MEWWAACAGRDLRRISAQGRGPGGGKSCGGWPSTGLPLNMEKADHSKKEGENNTTDESERATAQSVHEGACFSVTKQRRGGEKSCTGLKFRISIKKRTNLEKWRQEKEGYVRIRPSHVSERKKGLNPPHRRVDSRGKKRKLRKQGGRECQSTESG